MQINNFVYYIYIYDQHAYIKQKQNYIIRGNYISDINMLYRLINYKIKFFIACCNKVDFLLIEASIILHGETMIKLPIIDR